MGAVSGGNDPTSGAWSFSFEEEGTTASTAGWSPAVIFYTEQKISSSLPFSIDDESSVSRKSLAQENLWLYSLGERIVEIGASAPICNLEEVFNVSSVDCWISSKAYLVGGGWLCP